MARHKRIGHSCRGSSIARRLHVEQLEDRRLLAVFSVGNLNDAGAGSLRDAIDQANANNEADTISFAVTGTLDLASQLPTITDDLTITGPGQALLTLDAGDGDDNLFDTADGYRIFGINDGDNDNEIDVAISGLTLTGGDSNSMNVPDGTKIGGGAIRNFENLTLADSTLSSNAAFSGGGIMTEYGMLTMSRNTLVGNSAIGPGYGNGGGIYSGSGGVVTILESTISGNFAGGVGGGIVNAFGGTINIDESTISENSIVGSSRIARGGGIFNNSTMNINNSTISNNTALKQFTPFLSSGGGVFSVNGTVSITSSTISGNTAHNGGGLLTGSNVTTLDNTIVARNIAVNGADIDSHSTIPVTGSYNLIGDVITGQTDILDGFNGNQVGTAANPIDPRLGPLADNGGPTQTQALLPGSPALDAGNSSIVDSPLFDQRGAPFSRIADGNDPADVVIDIGAYEAQIASSADFDTDGDVDGADFLAWQRGFGKPNAVLADGNSDDDTDVDASDLAAWTLSFPPQEATPLVAQNPALLADLAFSTFSITEEKKRKEEILEPAILSSFTAFFTNSPDLMHAATTVNLSQAAKRTDTAKPNEPWIASELLGRVFG